MQQTTIFKYKNKGKDIQIRSESHCLLLTGTDQPSRYFIHVDGLLFGSFWLVHFLLTPFPFEVAYACFSLFSIEYQASHYSCRIYSVGQMHKKVWIEFYSANIFISSDISSNLGDMFTSLAVKQSVECCLTSRWAVYFDQTVMSHLNFCTIVMGSLFSLWSITSPF